MAETGGGEHYVDNFLDFYFLLLTLVFDPMNEAMSNG